MSLLAKVFTVCFFLKYTKCYFIAPTPNLPVPVPTNSVNETKKPDKCTQLYWYPRPVPESCFKDEEYNKPLAPMPLPIPVPLPMPYPMPIPMGIPLYPPGPMLPVAQMPPKQAYLHMVPGPALRKDSENYPHSAPYALPPVAPYPANVFPPFNPFVGPNGHIPPLGPPGGVHIMPQNNVYANLLKSIRHKKARRKLSKLIDDLDI